MVGGVDEAIGLAAVVTGAAMAAAAIAAGGSSPSAAFARLTSDREGEIMHQIEGIKAVR